MKRVSAIVLIALGLGLLTHAAAPPVKRGDIPAGTLNVRYQATVDVTPPSSSYRATVILRTLGLVALAGRMPGASVMFSILPSAPIRWVPRR